MLLPPVEPAGEAHPTQAVNPEPTARPRTALRRPWWQGLSHRHAPGLAWPGLAKDPPRTHQTQHITQALPPGAVRELPGRSCLERPSRTATCSLHLIFSQMGHVPLSSALWLTCSCTDRAPSLGSVSAGATSTCFPWLWACSRHSIVVKQITERPRVRLPGPLGLSSASDLSISLCLTRVPARPHNRGQSGTTSQGCGEGSMGRGECDGLGSDPTSPMQRGLRKKGHRSTI